MLGYVAPLGVGVDHNPTAVARCRARGYEAYEPWELAAAVDGPFDSLVFAHVLEHLPVDDALALVRDHLQWLRPGGRVVLICPQERGYRSDPTHVRFVDDAALAELCEQLGLVDVRRRSFPLPRRCGRLFVYNEFVVTARTPSSSPPHV